MSDHPFDEVIASVDQLLADPRITVYQKYTCGGCGQRLTMSEPNTFYTEGTCEECGHTTNIRAAGHNFLLVHDLRSDADRDVIGENLQ